MCWFGFTINWLHLSLETTFSLCAVLLQQKSMQMHILSSELHKTGAGEWKFMVHEGLCLQNLLIFYKATFKKA